MGDSSHSSTKRTPPRGYSQEHLEGRRAWFESHTGHEIPKLTLEDPQAYKGLVENQVGYMALPISVAGPLKIQGTYAQGEYYLPLCTLEGTLALSMTRGLYLTALSGGIVSQHIDQKLSRSPLFAMDTINSAYKFRRWAEQHIEQIAAAAQTTTRHGKLLRIEYYLMHNRVILDMQYHTAEAAGQNMVTIATQAACQWIEANYPEPDTIDYAIIESNFAGDKNASHRNNVSGRGHHVICSTMIPERYMKKLLRVNVESLVANTIDKQIGSSMAGVSGMNIHAANALAALYLALGQDVACIVENCGGSVIYEMKEGCVYASLSMPSITVGTVGGATRLTQQKKHLEILGCTGKNGSRKLAEIVCAAVLALEISLAGSIISNEFSSAHAQFGR